MSENQPWILALLNPSNLTYERKTFCSLYMSHYQNKWILYLMYTRIIISVLLFQTDYSHVTNIYY